MSSDTLGGYPLPMPGHSRASSHVGYVEGCPDCAAASPQPDAPARSFARSTDTEDRMTKDIPGADGTAHLAYYDRKHELSFVYDNRHADDNVEVSRGGYGERVTDRFSAFEFDDEWGANHGSYTDVFRRFERLCQAYVAHHYGANAAVRAFRRGIDGEDLNAVFDPDNPIHRAFLVGQNIRADLGLNE